MPNTDIVISNKLGLHARAAAKLTQLASKFSSEIFISRGAQRVNAKSIMGVMMLAAGLGVTVRLEGAQLGFQFLQAGTWLVGFLFIASKTRRGA